VKREMGHAMRSQFRANNINDCMFIKDLVT
jgi:hypothetical protein